MDLATILPSLSLTELSISKWAIFGLVVIVLLALDLFVFHTKPGVPGFRKSLGWTLFYTAIAMAFGGFVWQTLGEEKGLQFYAGYFMELSLSLDNIFVISLIFSAMGVAAAYQRRVLFWGIVGVLLLRGIMIALGAALVSRFEFVLFLFGILLLYTGYKMAFANEGHSDIKDSRLYKWLQKHWRITKDFHGHEFFVRAADTRKVDKTVLYVTPLFVTLVLVEVADLVFAIDSVPAIFGITTDAFIVFTSNIFAILGLRALYFTLQSMVARFAYLSKALAIVLIFVGGKIMYEYLFHTHLPIDVSLAVILTLIGSGVAISLLKTEKR